MNEQTIDETRRGRQRTDTALVVIAAAALAAWLFRRVRSRAIVDHAPPVNDASPGDETVGAIGLPGDETSA